MTSAAENLLTCIFDPQRVLSQGLNGRESPGGCGLWGGYEESWRRDGGPFRRDCRLRKGCWPQRVEFQLTGLPKGFT
jgi:hypothetical protein